MSRISKFIIILGILLILMGTFHGLGVHNVSASSHEFDGADDLTADGVINIFEGIACFAIDAVGSILIVVVIVSAILIMTAGDNTERITKARKTLIYGGLGGIIIFSVPFIINLVVTFLREAGADVTYEGFACGGSRPELFGTLLYSFGLINDIVAAAAVGIAVIAVIWGAILYMTSGSDPERVRAAQKTIINGLIGAVVMFSLSFIIGFIFGASRFLFN